MANDLLPERLRRALWTNRKHISAVQVLSEDTSIPWEMMFLSDPDRQDVDGEGFLAEFGVIRWLHDTQWPPTRLSIRPERVRYVVPTYPVPEYVLPEAQKERDVLAHMFPGSVQLEADSVLLDAQLRRPGPIDILHVSGHGLSTVGNVIQASLLMTGRVDPQGRYEPDELTDSIVKTALAFEPNSQPIVFLNACQAGRSGNSMVGVGGFAGAFLKPTSNRGAGAFIGAQWSVGDATALTFATTFYQSLLAGQTLVAATRAARTAAKAAGELSWLSYTVYGDPAAVAVRP
jgi:CHAT domain-containing protein